MSIFGSLNNHKIMQKLDYGMNYTMTTDLQMKIKRWIGAGTV